MPSKSKSIASKHTCIIGGGPAGLTTAYELTRNGSRATVLEQGTQAGGLSRTENYKGFLFDIGGHRFFTKVPVVLQMWRTVLADDLLVRPRLSRVFYNGHFYRYPLDAFDTVRKLGILESFLSMCSYARARCFQQPHEEDLETWLINRFGKRLYERFFKTYTEKVWGMKCSEISADWAAQRIKGLSMGALLRNFFHKVFPAKDTPELKTLIEEFLYPRQGPGMMWERTAKLIEGMGSEVQYNAKVEAITWQPGAVTGVRVNGHLHVADHYVSTMPMRTLVARLDPAAPPELKIVESLRYRDFITVAVVLRCPSPFPDNWIYVHDPGVRVGRIQNFKNWSPEMVPDPALTCLGLEYFTFENDDLWSMSDADLLALAAKELETLGLTKAALAIDGKVIRVPKAYPVYDDVYIEAIAAVRKFIETQLPNLQCAGRNGMHRYNNQDHSMLTGMLAARNILGLGEHNLWQVNADDDYHEDGFALSAEAVEHMEQTQPHVPTRVVASSGS